MLPKEVEKKTEIKGVEYKEYPFPYWSMTKKRLISHFNSSERGVSSKEASVRLLKYGKNEVKEKRQLFLLNLVLRNLFSPISIALFLAGATSFIIGDQQSSLIIFILVLLSVVINVVQEYRSHKVVEKLQKLVTYSCNVIRDGKVLQINSRELVPGDVVHLSVGDRIPADMRILSSENLKMDESLITGEYYPVTKTSRTILKKSPIPQEMENIAFTGSIVKEGKGLGMVIATGKSNFIGRTVRLIDEIKDESNFEMDLKKFSQYLLNVILLVVILVTLVNIYVQHDFVLSFLFAVTLAVGLIPEPLPLMIATVLSRGAMKLASKGVIVKRMSATEDLGNVDVLCCDKTGTLTENRLRVIDSFNCDGSNNTTPVILGAVCSSVILQDHHVRGNQIDVALHEFVKMHDSIKEKKEEYVVEQEIPFDYERQRMSVVAKLKGQRILVSKGSPEAILSSSAFALEKGKVVHINRMRSKIMETYKDLSRQGLRLIAVGIKELGKKKSYSKSDESELIFVGFISFIDPPKHSARETLQLAKKYGIDIKIITGDGAEVTKTIANQLHFNIPEDRIMSGHEIDMAILTNDISRIENTTIFSRATPQQKLKIIKILRSKGHVVAYLGDGVNDAPSLMEADVGVSVNEGSDVSKEAADIILTHKTLHSVIDGILIGRTLFTNIAKYLRCTFAGNFGNLFTIAFASGFLRFIPLLPSQLLYINFLTDFPLFTFSVDNVDNEELKQPKRWRTDHIIRNGAIFGAISTVFDLILIFYLIYMLGVTEELFRTVFFLEIIFSEVFVVLSLRSTKPFFMANGPSFFLVFVIFLSALIGVASVFPPLANYFGFETPITDLLVFVVMLSVGYALTTELVKFLVYRNNESNKI